MKLKQALDIISSAIPIKPQDYYDELLSQMVNYVEIKTQGFSYEQGISDEPADLSKYVSASVLLEKLGTERPSEKDIVIWLAKQLKAKGLVRESTHLQKSDRTRILKLLELENINAEAELDLLLLS